MTFADDVNLVEEMYRRGRLALIGELTAYHHAAEELTGPDSTLAEEAQVVWVTRKKALADAIAGLEDAR